MAFSRFGLTLTMGGELGDDCVRKRDGMGICRSDSGD